MFAENPTATTTVFDAANDDVVRQRLNSFKLGKPMPPSVAPAGQNSGHRHRRSHSRNASISTTSSASLSLSSSRSSGLHDLSNFAFGSMPSSTSLTSSASSNDASAPAAPPSKRNSHHRRRSSVSTRHESAELMGVSLPDMPSVSFDDNANLGEKDSIRRRALWALEGKHDVSFSKVEIPELTTPDVEKLMFDFSSKPPVSGGLSTGFGSSLMGSKRDSFKLLASSGSSKDQLHTLVEEEEEEEEDCSSNGKQDPQETLPSPAESTDELVPSAPSVAVTKATPVKPRPATLNLRPLSLTPETLGSVNSQGLPTPSLTPSPRPGLRSLSLSSTTSLDESPAQALEQSRRAPSVTLPGHGRRPLLSLSTDSSITDGSPSDDQKPARRSSISYRSSSHATYNPAGLPTPEMTPTFSRRCSVSESVRSSKSGDDEFFPAQPSYRPLSASEQHFLYKSHNALLARITDLEKALTFRRSSLGGFSFSAGSRPSSMISDGSLPSEAGSSLPGEPSDEMLALVRDLKAERDELKKDVDGWRTRVADLDKQLELVAKRVDTERRAAWLARSRVGLVEAEKGVLERRAETLTETVTRLEAEKLDLENQNRELRTVQEEKARRVEELEEELKSLRQELESERARRESIVDPLATPTPSSLDDQCRWKRGLAFGSMDSATDVESDEAGLFNFGRPLNPVAEADEVYSDEEDGLEGYEDEDESDPYLETSSSFDSVGDCPPRPTSVGARASPISSLLTDSITEGSEDSFDSVKTPPIRGWTFPKVAAEEVKRHKQADSVDKFFGCFDESDYSDDSGPVTPMPCNYEESKDLFASGFKFAEGDDAPFYLPGGVGTVVEEPVIELKNDRVLSAVTEEEEEDDEEQSTPSDVEEEDMFCEMGGIRITFTPPDDVEPVKEVEQMQITPPKPVSTPPVLPAFDFGFNEEEEMSFTFGSPARTSPPASKAATISTPSKIPTMITPPSSLPRSTSSPRSSAIPRPTSRTSANNDPCQSPRPASAYATPPSKRGGVMPSFIPQPVSSPSPSRISPLSKPRPAVPGPTFVRPPDRAKPVALPNPRTSKHRAANFANGSTSNSSNATIRPLTLAMKFQPQTSISKSTIRPLK